MQKKHEVRLRKIPLLYNLQILLAQQPNQNLDDRQYNSVNIPTTNYESKNKSDNQIFFKE